MHFNLPPPNIIVHSDMVQFCRSFVLYALFCKWSGFKHWCEVDGFWSSVCYNAPLKWNKFVALWGEYGILSTPRLRINKEATASAVAWDCPG